MATLVHKVPRVCQFVTLLGSVLVSLGSGTNYIYSAYAPQLGACLRLSYTQLNIIGLAGNTGACISGPVCGYIVDRNGPRILLVGGSICLLIGYLSIKKMYDDCISDDSTISTLRFALLVMCGFITGTGGCAGLFAAMNVTAKIFPPSSRATTTALVMSGFGLSAFFFSLLAYLFFPGDTSALLLTLAIGTATMVLMGLFTIRTVYLPPTNLSARDMSTANGYNPVQSEDGAIPNEPQATFVLEADNEAYRDSGSLILHAQEPTSYQTLVSSPNAKVDSPANLLERIVENSDILPDIHGRRLWLTPDFHLIFAIIVICSGTGVMYINNVGSIIRALYASTHLAYDEVEASKWQATQVSILSLGNFAGRICIGLVSDFAYTRHRLPRAYSFCIVSFLFIMSQATAMGVSSVETLWIATLLVGFAYGSLCGSYISVLIEWFGLAHFSENMGYTEFAFVAGQNLFSLVFAHIMDAHESVQAARPSFELTPDHQCLDGRACYLTSFQVTLVTCIISFGLSWWAGIREGQKAGVRNVYVRE